MLTSLVLTAWGLVTQHPRLGFQPLREVAPYVLTRDCRARADRVEPPHVREVYGLLRPNHEHGGRGIETNDIERLWGHVVAVEEANARRGAGRCQARLEFDRGSGVEVRVFPPGVSP